MTRWQETLTSNPWKALPTPSATEAVMAQRVDTDLEWKFYWAKDPEKRCAWLMPVADAALPQGPVPHLRGIDVRLGTNETTHEGTLSLTLLDSSSRDLFYSLCTDVMICTRAAANEKDAAAAALSRTWRWHHLLRGAGSGILADEAQKGLIGELEVLRRLLLPTLGGFAAVQSWLGPMDAPKDFEVGRLAIEVKARRGAANPFVTINSASQLDESGCDALFLAVIEVTSAAPDAAGAVTLTQVVDAVYEALRSDSPGALEIFESRLAAAGFRGDDDYSDCRWIVGGYVTYRVDGEFPRITAYQIPQGIGDVSYRVALPALAPFEVDHDAITTMISESRS